MMSYCPRDFSLYAAPADFVDYGSKFVCGSSCCTVAPTAPAHGLGIYSGLPFGVGAPPCNGFLPEESYADCCAVRRGPAGWTELGWVGSVQPKTERRRRLPWSEQAHEHRCNHDTCNATRGTKRNRVNRIRPSGSAGSGGGGSKWTPRRQYRDAERRLNDDYDEDWDAEYTSDDDDQYRRGCYGGGGGGGLQVQCRVRRYRLYARPFFGWCRGYDANQWQYAVVEEGVPRCDAIFIVLPDDPRFGRRGDGYRRTYGGRQRLESGELIRVPGEPGPFRVHLYADDDRY